MRDIAICIPGYNRPNYLEWTLRRARKDFPEAELVVSDDGSPQDMSGVRDMALCRWIQQSENIGPFPNFRAAMLGGARKYCLYLANDDYLLPEQVAAGIEYLEHHPGVVCYYAPCQLYDEIEQKIAWDAFYPAEDKTYHKAEDLWNFVIHKHVWPEHAIWRREGLEDILQPRVRAYWAFLDLANAFAKGPVHFAKKPYYRNLTQHPIGTRVKLGDRQCLTLFDEYRSGLEVLAYRLFKDRLTPELKVNLNAMIQYFINLRIDVARTLLERQAEQREADSYGERLAICA
jgi:glycosyltransferase involved in cell wall biosynthesis